MNDQKTTDTEAAQATLDPKEVQTPTKELKQPKAKAEAMQPATMAQAFIKFQQTVPNIKKDAKGKYGEYTSLDELINKALPVLNGLGFSFRQDVYTNEASETMIQSILTFHTGETMESRPLRLSVDGVGMQKLGSAITYGRRYQASSYLGLVTDKDDDGQTAQDATTENVTKAKATADKDRQKYIQYINAIAQKLDIQITQDLNTLIMPAMITLAQDLKTKLDAKTDAERMKAEANVTTA